MLNLIDGQIQNSNLFMHMPIFDEIYYEGFLEKKVRIYRAIREDQPCKILVLNVKEQMKLTLQIQFYKILFNLFEKVLLL